MGEYDFRSRDRSQKREPHRNSEGRIQYLLLAEEQLLHSISTRAPLPEVLNKICSALDCQIGNMVSLISLPDDEATDLAATAANAAFFGLHIFCSARVVAENDDVLGLLEMYCCVPRSPSGNELQWIERATCLAAIAIELHNEADRQDTCCLDKNRPARGRVLEWPVPVN